MLDKDCDADKLSILDVLARDEHGRTVNIEIQTTLPAGLRQRLTLFAASLFAASLSAASLSAASLFAASLFLGPSQEGDGYSVLNPAIGICVLGKTLIRQSPRVHHEFRVRSEDVGLVLTDSVQIHRLELPNYTVPSDNRVITEPLGQSCFLFRKAAELTPAEVLSRLPGPEFKKAVGPLEMIARTPAERSQYKLRLKMQRRDEAARIEAARKQGLELGLEQGREEGEARCRVRVLESLLGIESSANFDSLNLDELAARKRDLQSQLRKRGIG